MKRWSFMKRWFAGGSLQVMWFALSLLAAIFVPGASAHGLGEHKCIHDHLHPHEHLFTGRRHFQNYGGTAHGHGRRLQAASQTNATYRNPRDGMPLRLATELRVQPGALTDTQTRWLREVLLPMATDWWQKALLVRRDSRPTTQRRVALAHQHHAVPC